MWESQDYQTQKTQKSQWETDFERFDIAYGIFFWAFVGITVIPWSSACVQFRSFNYSTYHSDRDDYVSTATSTVIPLGLPTFSSTLPMIFSFTLLLVKSCLFSLFLAWVAICLTSNLSLRRRWFELLDSPRSGVYSLHCTFRRWSSSVVESGIWLWRHGVFSQAEDYVLICRFRHIRGRSCLALCHKDVRFFPFLYWGRRDAMRCDAFVLFYSTKKAGDP